MQKYMLRRWAAFDPSLGDMAHAACLAIALIKIAN
jgi:hypothetical protein